MLSFRIFVQKMSSNEARTFALKFVAFLILVLWVCYISMLGNELFTEIYKRPCFAMELAFVEYAFMVGCLSFVCFVFFRVYAGVSPCTRKSEITNVTQILYVAHTMSLFVCMEATAMSFTHLKALRCGSFDPSAAPFVIASFIMLLNGFLAVEQFGVVVMRPEIRIRSEHETLDEDIKELVGQNTSNAYQIVTLAQQSMPKFDTNAIPHTD